MERIEAQIMQHITINNRNAWIYLIQSNLGDLYITQHECVGYELIDDYIGWSPEKAEKSFKRITHKMIDGKN